MVVRGMAEFVTQREPWLFQDYELSKSFLVIDGNALAIHLFVRDSRNNCFFGGDYDRFARKIAKCFQRFSECEVTPLVFLEGGCDQRKVSRFKSEVKERLTSAFEFNQTMLNKKQFYPLFMIEILKEVMRKKQVKFVQTLFESNRHMASVAKILNCPVLSNDSDFFIYDVKFISFENMDLLKNRVRGTTKVKPCRMFQLKHLLQRFQGLHQLHIPLAAAVLGNDYVPFSMFRNFMDISDPRQRALELFVWLSKKLLHNAVHRILKAIPAKNRKKALETIEMTINEFTNVDEQMLHFLEFDEKLNSDHRKKFTKREFRFHGIIEKFRVEPKSVNYLKLGHDKEPEDPDVAGRMMKFKYAKDIKKVSPPWFLNEYHRGLYSPFFIDIFTSGSYVGLFQIEDYSCLAAAVCSSRLVGLIFGLLTKGLREDKPLLYAYRDLEGNLKSHRVRAPKKSSGIISPNFYHVRNFPFLTRKGILDEVLGVPGNAFRDVPRHWRLYMATAVLWLSKLHDSFNKKSYLYAFVLSMLFGVIDKKLGQIRSEKKLIKMYGIQLEPILYTSGSQFSETVNPNLTVKQAYDLVKMEDCLKIVPFFIKMFNIDKLLLEDKVNYQISVVHNFAQFQICLYHTLHINTLLDLPYEQTIVSEVYNGTLMYNLFLKLKETEFIDYYVFDVLGWSPSLLRLFDAILLTLKQLTHIK